MFDAFIRKQSCEVLNRLTIVSKLLHSDSALVRSQPKLKSLVQANSTRIKRKFKGKFIENLFLDKFEPSILEYPQLDTLLEYHILKKHYLLVQKLLSSSFNDNETVYERESEKLVSTLKNLEFTGFRVPLEDGGFGYLNSEYMLLHEAFGVKPSLSKIICENEDFGIQLISSSGSETQKSDYLQKLSTGQMIACFAHLESEPLVTRGPMLLKTTAVKTPDGGYVVSGTKNWVYNASNADVIIFSANVTSDDLKQEAQPALFIANKNTPGIEIHKPFNLLGMKGLDVCEISFNNVVVPPSCMLGDAADGSEIIKQVLSSGKLNNGAQCVAIMKKLVNMALIHCINNKFFKKNKYEKNYYRIKIGKIASKIYTVESMTYLLTGRLDSEDEADVFLESLIGKIYASENLQYVLHQSLTILGSEGFSEENGLSDIIKDSQFYMACDDTNDHLRLMLSTAGCEYMLNHKPDDVLQSITDTLRRNAFKLFWHINGETPLRTRQILRGYVHLMFASESHMLEDSVFLLHVTAKKLIKKYGDKVFERHLELKFLADIVINIYAMTATLARASRAFCLGVRNDKVDKNVTYGEIHRMHCEIRDLMNVIKHSKFSDARKVGSSLLNCNNYADQYPIRENLLIRNKCN